MICPYAWSPALSSGPEFGASASRRFCPVRFASCTDVAVRLVGRPDRGRGKGVLIASGRLGTIASAGHTKRARLKITRRGRELIANRGGTMNVSAITSSAQTKNARQLRSIRPR